MSNECVEIAPDWLSKLEKNREKLAKSKLGHESGAGSKCNQCLDKCPGLDLHFWRKVCRNCKCSKSSHECDDLITGWAQFEILGQIRSKPAYIKISAHEDQLVDWIPPNLAPDLLSDYMKQLGSEYIPISGSVAASKRKQQLEFQVPPHDLDPTLCDNLTITESEQLKQYVHKIKENSVGQGNIVRIDMPKILYQQNENIQEIPKNYSKIKTEYSIIPTVYNDKIMCHILNSEIVSGLLHNPAKIINGSRIQTFDRSLKSDFDQNPYLSDKNKYKLKLMKVNSQAIQSSVVHGLGYDNLLNTMKVKNIDYSKDTLIKPIDDLRNEYLRNDKFQKDINNFVNSLGKHFLDTIPELSETSLDIINKPNSNIEITNQGFTTPIKGSGLQSDMWNSPLPIKNLQSKQGNLMQQETPIRKINLGKRTNIQDIFNSNGQAIVPSIEYDRILSTVLHSDVVKGLLHDPSRIIPDTKMEISSIPLKPDFVSSPYLTDNTKDILENMKMNSQAIQSGVLHGWVYDKLFPDLHNKKINYSTDTILGPIEKFRCEFNENEPFKDDVNNFVSAQGREFIDNTPVGSINPSKSNDSGFESIPPTPNFSTYPGSQSFATQQLQEFDDNKIVPDYELAAESGELLLIPGITDLNMYPQIKTGIIQNPYTIDNLNQGIGDIQISQDLGQTKKHAVLNCKQCQMAIVSGEIAVKAERAGKNVGWHPQCFVCHKCNELLADLVYFFHGDNIYCARDLAVILKIPRCNACDELIFTKEYTAAEGATFHIKHFCCYQCDEPLAGKQYLPDEKTNMPLCLKCYDEFYAEKCQLCQQIIGPKNVGVSFGTVHWHADCFNCAGHNCHKSLIGGRFCVKENKPFCSQQCIKTRIQ